MAAAVCCEDRILSIVLKLLAERAIHGSLAPEDNLREAGLTSLDMVNLVLSVEAEFDLMIPISDIIPANFRSVSTISDLARRLRSDAQ